jgi:hypothetical protein
LEKLGDPLIFLRTKIDWESFRPAIIIMVAKLAKRNAEN